MTDQLDALFIKDENRHINAAHMTAHARRWAGFMLY